MILQHPRAAVKFDPPVTEDSIAAAKAAAASELGKILRYKQLRDDDMLELSRMVDVHGAPQVRLWLDNLAYIAADVRRG